MSDPTDEAQTQGQPRLRPHTPAAWVTVTLATIFVALWIVFAIRAVARNDVTPPTVIVPPPTATPDLRATVEAANRLLFPDRPDGSPGATPVASPIGSPVASPVGSAVASPVATPPG